MDAFWILNTSRNIGFECVGFIPLTEIESFCRLYGVEDVEYLISIVQHLDRLFVDFQNKKLKSKTKG